jgi:Glucodextranase, domain B
MRISLVLGLSLLATACSSESGALLDPPLLTVTSPQRATLREQAGLVQVTGQVAPNATTRERIAKVTVNDVQATVASDGSFSADVVLAAGATMLHTVAVDVAGGEATDTRTIHAGPTKSGADLIGNGVYVALSDEALGVLAATATDLIKTTDFATFLAPLNPVISAGADNGEDCLWGKVSVNDVDLTDPKLTLTPTASGLTFSAEVKNLDVPARARYKAACVIEGTTDIRMRATKVAVSGTLQVTPKAGGAGFNVKVVGPNVAVTGFDLTAGGLTGEVLEILDLDTTIANVVTVAVEHFMSPLMNQALGGLAGPKRLDLLGQSLELQVAANAVAFDVVSANVGLDTRMYLAGHDARFVSTAEEPIRLSAGAGFAIGLADDAANQLLASVAASGLLGLSLPAVGGTFDSAAIAIEMPPMISTDPLTGKIHILAGDMTMTFKQGETEVGHVALNIATAISAEASGFGGVKLIVDRPEVYADVIDNATGYVDDDQEEMIKLVVDHQVELFSLLFGNIPLPAIAGVQMKDMKLEAGEGFIKISGKLKR